MPTAQFVLVVQIRASDPEELAAQHERYAELAGRFPGIRYKHVMRSQADPERYIDLMAWEQREQSELFGIDPEYQKARPPRPVGRPAGTAGDDNPGYYAPVAEFVREEAAIGRQELAIVDAKPGREQALAEAGRALVSAAEALPGVASVRVLRNLGWPARHTIAVAYVDADAAASPSLAETAATRDAWARLAECCAAMPQPESGPLVVRWDGAG